MIKLKIYKDKAAWVKAVNYRKAYGEKPPTNGLYDTDCWWCAFNQESKNERYSVCKKAFNDATQQFIRVIATNICNRFERYRSK